MNFAIFLLFLISFCIVRCSDLSKNTGLNPTTIGNAQKIYNYIKHSLTDNNSLSSNDYIRYHELINIEEVANKKKSKKKGDLDLEKKRNELKAIKRKIKLLRNQDSLFRMFEDSSLFRKLMESSSSWTVDELRELKILGDNQSSSLFSKLNLGFTQIGYFLSLLSLVNEEGSSVTNKLYVLNDIDVNALIKLFNKLKDIESNFIDLYSIKTLKNRYKIGDNDYNALIDFRQTMVKRTNHLNKKFLFLFLNPYLIGFLLINIFCAISEDHSKLYKSLYCGICNISNWKNFSFGNCLSIFFSVLNYFLLYKVVWRVYKYILPDCFYSRLAKRFYIIKTYIDTIKSIYEILQFNEPVFNVFGDGLKKCRNLFFDNEDFSNDQKEMIRLLFHIPAKLNFKDRLVKGNVFNLCKFFLLFDRHKNLFVDPLLEIANLEKYISIYRLLKDNSNGLICVPKFIDSKNNPCIKFTDLYNPFLSPDKAIKNNVVFGRGTSENASLGIIYGMNAAGKSTILKAIALNYILGKSLGICYARDAEITNFKRIYLAIDISDDIGNRRSKFMSEVITVDELLDIVFNLKDHESVLFLSDELFSGTCSEASDLFTNNILRFLTNNEAVITLFSTHSIRPLDLAKNSDNIAVYTMDLDLSNTLVEYKYKIDRYKGKIETIVDNSPKKFGLLDRSKKVAVALINDLYYRGLIKHPEIFLGDNIESWLSG